MPIARLSHLIVLVVTCGLMVTSPVSRHVAAAPPDFPVNRVQTGIKSSQGMKDDLKYLVVTLGQNSKAWEDIELAIDAFLPGVDLNLPVGMDLVLDPEKGKRKLLHIPIGNMRTFFAENLTPIGINPRRRTRDYYWLDGLAALGWEGWMRTMTGSVYGSISEVEPDIAAGVPAPDANLTALLATGHDSAARLVGALADAGLRKQGIDKLREDLLEGIRRRPDESEPAFDLRKLAGKQQMDRLERIYVHGKLMTAGWTTDAVKGTGFGEMYYSAHDGTDLHTTLLKAGTTPSFFGAIPEAKSVVFLTRLNVPIDSFSQAQFEEFYGKLRPVMKQRIADKKVGTPEQTEARQRIVDHVLDFLLDTLKLGTADLFAQTTPSAAGKNVIVAGVRSNNGELVLPILRELPNAITGWKLEEAVATVGTVSIHRLDISSDIPKAVKDFYGESGEVFVATSTQAVWFAGGDGALEALKVAIQQVADGSPVADGVVAYSKLKLGPVSRHIRELGTEEGFSLSEFMGKVRAGREPRNENERGANRNNNAGALRGINWDDQFREALNGVNNDLVETTIWVKGGEVTSKTNVENGVLIGIGRIIGNVGGDLLGG